jgi:hypothetical protein
MAWIRALLVLAVLAPAARADTSRSYSVEVEPSGDWRAEALAIALARDLADDRLVLSNSPSAELVVQAAIDERALRYRLRATWPGAPTPIDGAIALGSTRATVAGQLRDQLHRLARATRDDRAEVAIRPPSPGAVAFALAIIAGLVAVPFVVLARQRAIAAAWPALRRALFALTGVGGVLLAGTFAPAMPWLLAAGLAWGTVIAVTVPIVFPPLIGFGRVEQGQLARVIGTWLAAVARRAPAVALACTAIAGLTWLITSTLAIDATLAAALALPLALLAARLWLRCAVAAGAVALDARLVEDAADADAWHPAVCEYVVGYLRRAGMPVDDELLARVRFVPSSSDAVVVYGGGLTPSRIAIPRRMLELALAPAGRPHDYSAPRVSTLHWTQWNAGLVVPSEPGAVIANSEQRQPRSTVVEGEHERQLIGQPPTLAGTIDPSDLDAPPAYRPHEDRIWLDWDPGEEYDGTDPADLDFLFGAIVHALGEIQRHGDRLATISILARRSPRATALSDEHAALAGARHHLVQYLSWRLWQREDVLTARAFAGELETATARIRGELARVPTADRRLRRRLARLADPARPAVWRRFALAGAFAAAAALAASAVMGAVRYHAEHKEPAHG